MNHSSIPERVTKFFSTRKRPNQLWGPRSSLSHGYRGSRVDSAYKRNEFQEYFLGGKGGRRAGMSTLPPSCADCLEIWEPQPHGTLRACNRAVHGLLYLYICKSLRSVLNVTMYLFSFLYASLIMTIYG